LNDEYELKNETKDRIVKQVFLGVNTCGRDIDSSGRGKVNGEVKGG
jgi:hypothetical protein